MKIAKMSTYAFCFATALLGLGSGCKLPFSSSSNATTTTTITPDGSITSDSGTPATVYGMSCAVANGIASGDYATVAPIFYVPANTMNGTSMTSITLYLSLDNASGATTYSTGLVLDVYTGATLGSALPASDAQVTVTAALGGDFTPVTFTFGGQGINLAANAGHPMAFQLRPYNYGIGATFDSHLLLAETPSRGAPCFLFESPSTTQANTNISTKTIMATINASN